jgi:hypothetical protein
MAARGLKREIGFKTIRNYGGFSLYLFFQYKAIDTHKHQCFTA